MQEEITKRGTTAIMIYARLMGLDLTDKKILDGLIEIYRAGAVDALETITPKNL